MRNKRGKLLGFMLTLALVIGLLPVMSLTVYAETTTYKLEIKYGIENGTLYERGLAGYDYISFLANDNLSQILLTVGTNRNIQGCNIRCL